jgi:hypothetical protein
VTARQVGLCYMELLQIQETAGCLSRRKWFEEHINRVCEERDCKPVVRTKRSEG